MIKDTISYSIQDFRIQTKTIENYTMSTHHFHDVYELYYMNEGTRNYFINDASHLIREGDLVLVKPYDLHKTIDTGSRHSRVLISFQKDFLPFKDAKEIIDACFSSSKVLTFDFVTQNFIESKLKSMVLCANSQQDYFCTHLQCQFIDLLIEIANYIRDNKKADVFSTPAHQKVYEIIQYLKKNYAQDITLDQLSQEFFISQYYMTRIFKKTTGFTIIEYIHSLRVIQAQQLLKETPRKIIDIAQAVGFNNVSNFGKVFKSITGMSPMQYRKNHRH